MFNMQESRLRADDESRNMTGLFFSLQIQHKGKSVQQSFADTCLDFCDVGWIKKSLVSERGQKFMHCLLCKSMRNSSLKIESIFLPALSMRTMEEN